MRLTALVLLACGFSTASAQNALLDAASADLGARAVQLLDDQETSVDVNARGPDGSTALHWAVYFDDDVLVERLLAAGATIDVSNEFGSTPMAEAATSGNPAVLKALLDAGADPDTPGADGQTPLMVVARSSNVEAARVLLDAGADVNAREAWREQSALMWAAAQRQPEMTRLLIEHGADVDARSAVNQWPRQVTGEPRRMYRPFGGLTPLMMAARSGCLDCTKALVEAGADIDLADPKNVTPLFLAVDNLHFDTAKYLIEAGANPNKWDWLGRTPLYSAVDVNTLPHGGRADLRSLDDTTSLEIIEMLLAAGANPNPQIKMHLLWRHIGDDRGCDLMLTVGATPLLRAAKTFDTAAMRVLIDNGANVDLPNAGGITPLMAAAGFGSIECDPRGYGPGIPHYVTPDVQEASIRAVDMLLDAGADINATTLSGEAAARAAGRTALFGAAFWGWNDVVERLVERGAIIDARDAEGLTAVDAAMGRAGGHGRGGTIEVYAETAELLQALCGAAADCEFGG